MQDKSKLIELLLIEHCRVIWEMGCQELSAIQGYERLTEDLIQQVSKWKEIHLTYMGNE